MRENHTRRKAESFVPRLLIDGLIDFIEFE